MRFGIDPAARQVSELEIVERASGGVVAIHRANDTTGHVVSTSSSRELVEELVGKLHVEEGDVRERDPRRTRNAGRAAKCEVVDQWSDLLDREVSFAKRVVLEHARGHELANSSASCPVEREHGTVPEEVAVLLELLFPDPFGWPVRARALPPSSEPRSLLGAGRLRSARTGIGVQQQHRFIPHQRVLGAGLFGGRNGQGVLPA